MTNLQADNLIESRLPLKRVIPLFPSRIAAYEYFARSMARTYAVADSTCCVCRRECQEPPVVFTWRATVNTARTVIFTFVFTLLALLAHHAYSHWEFIEFTTFHRLCRPCKRRQRLRRILISVAQKVLFAVLILLLCLTVPAVVFGAALPFIAPELIRIALTASAIGLSSIAIVAWAFEMCRKSLIPYSLRQIGRFPFFLYALRKAA